MPLLRISNVYRSFRRGSVVVHAISGVSLTLEAGEAVGLIGESGSGKSTLGRLALGLLQPDAGHVEFDNQVISGLSYRKLQRLRSQMTVVFQEPLQSLNPRLTVGAIVEEPLTIHNRSLTHTQRREVVRETFARVGLDGSLMSRYPHHLSGGQQQRVGIARAIITRPKLVVLDEPTSSLDLSVRATILNLLGDLGQTLGLAFLFISHDIATVRHFCSRTAVMYLGRIVESGMTSQVTEAPLHPYTQALLSAELSVDPMQQTPHHPLSGDTPASSVLRRGCPLVGRCPIELPECSEAQVLLREIVPGHSAACIRAGGPSPLISKLRSV